MANRDNSLGDLLKAIADSGANMEDRITCIDGSLVIHTNPLTFIRTQ